MSGPLPTTIKHNKQCLSIKSKKFSNLRCPNEATRGDWCSRHSKSKNAWTSNTPAPKPFTRKQKVAAEVLQRFWKLHCRWRSRRSHGPALFTPSESQNDRDIYSFDPIQTIPYTYHFSYADSERRIWTFDLRFLLHLLQYGNELKNPYTQELLPASVVTRLQTRSEVLKRQKVPIVYTEPEGLTPEQIWNQKVLDVFLKLTALGFGVNVLWFESLTTRGHENFYRSLYDQWTYSTISHQERDRLVPGYNGGRAPLFRWSPEHLYGRALDLKWWRKTNLALMNAFLSRGQDRATQGCGALYLLTGLARTHPRAREAFPYLAELEEDEQV